MNEGQWRDRFPDGECLRVFSELSVWTSVDDCLAAARWIEGRTRPEDALSETLVIPYPDDEAYEAVLVQCFGWLIRSFRVPGIKLRMASLLDRTIAAKTCATLTNTRFTPDIDKGPPGAIGTFFPSLASHGDKRFFVVKDSPGQIELVQNPIRCLLDMIDRSWTTAIQIRALRKATRETGTTPEIFHQPYTDGPLFALIEAVAFDLLGMTIGPIAVRDIGGISIGYRSFEVIERPPVDPRLLDVAQHMTTEMFRTL